MRTARVPGNFYKKMRTMRGTIHEMRTMRGYPQFGADYLSMDRVFRFDSQTAAALVGFAVMAILGAYNKKAKKKWIRDWGFTVSMFVGMIVSMLF